jgi:uncharacterized protein YceH (UPF0502 family)
VAYDEATVEAAVTSIKTKGLARFVHPSHGRSALRYAHSLDEALGLAPPQLALVAVLMLRGPQTLGELRTRTERMVEFSDLREVQAELDALAERTEPLTQRLPRGPGQKEDRFGQLLGGSSPPPTTTWRGRDPDRLTASAARDPAPALDVESGAVDSGAVAALRAELVELRAEVGALRRALDDLREQLGA